MDWDDLIGKALDIYKVREESKISERLAASTIQAQQYETTWKLQQAQADAAGGVGMLPSWMLPLAGLLALGAVVYMVAR